MTHGSFEQSSTDHLAHKLPVSVKAVIVLGDQVPLLLNERNEWELPGGKLEPGESPEHCLIREIEEELSTEATISSIIDSWVYRVHENTDVLIITYLALVDQNSRPQVSDEHKELKLFDIADIKHINMPEGYKKSIYSALAII